MYSNRVMDERINDRIHNERDRKILHRRKIDGLTYERLAMEFDMSPRQIKNIVYKYEPILHWNS